jgi:photosystem II stability/assembly factor-like uncharacterized protein
MAIRKPILFLLPVLTLSAVEFPGLEWRLIGPFRAGRTVAAAGVPGDPATFYFGAVGGGVWKSRDAGNTWKPIFDGQPVASIGAMAVAPSDPNVIYVGTGESDWRSDLSAGAGVYKSIDAGKSWKLIGLEETRHIGRIVVHPKDPNIVYVAAMGHAYGPNEQRGVFVSRDGGTTWNRTLYKGPDLCAIDLAMPASDPNTIYATLWRARRSTWSQYPPVEGPGGGLYKSTDAGATWNPVTSGLPAGQWGRAGLTVSNDGRRVYTLIDSPKEGGLYRSDNAGETFTQVSKDARIFSRGWYFGRIAIDPNNPDTVYSPNVALYKSTDGGRNFTILRGAPGGDDYHFLWIDPTDSRRMICATDQGATLTLNGGETWTGWYNQPTAQMYHVTTDDEKPYYNVYGSQQDSGTAAIPSRTNRGVITDADRMSVGGGESGYIAVDPRDSNIVYVNDTNGKLSRMDRRTGQSQIITPVPRSGFGVPIYERKYRHPWTSPLVFSPTDPDALYYGSQYVMKSVDGGLTWKEISPDLTGDRKVKSSEPPSNANTKDRGFGTVYSIAPSPVQPGVIWAGSDTGLIHFTKDAGESWANITPPNLSDWSKVTHIEASRFAAGSAYAAVDRHRLDDYNPQLYRTRDFGKTWVRIDKGIAPSHSLNAVREDPQQKGLLFATTEFGVYVSFNDGDEWQPLQLNLPVTSVRDIVIKGRDLVIATHGRSFWILDDITPLRQFAAANRTLPAVHLFKPENAVRVFYDDFFGTPLPPEIPQAKVPEPGAVIDYMLDGSGGVVKLEILDASGSVIRTYSSADTPQVSESRRRSAIADIWLSPPPRLKANAGHNRFVWDFRHQPLNAETEGPRVIPGSFTVRLTAAGKQFTQPLTVVNDPRSKATAADLAKQEALAREIYTEMKRALGNQAAMSDLATALSVVESADREAPASARTMLEDGRKKIQNFSRQ